MSGFLRIQCPLSPGLHNKAAIPLLLSSGTGADGIDWRHLDRWLNTSAPDDAVMFGVRPGGLALAAWLVASTVLYRLARLTAAPALLLGIEWPTVPPSAVSSTPPWPLRPRAQRWSALTLPPPRFRPLRPSWSSSTHHHGVGGPKVIEANRGRLRSGGPNP